MLEIRDCWSLSLQSRKIRHQRSPSNSSRQPTRPSVSGHHLIPRLCRLSAVVPRDRLDGKMLRISLWFRRFNLQFSAMSKPLKHWKWNALDTYMTIYVYIWDISTAIYDQIPWGTLWWETDERNGMWEKLQSFDLSHTSREHISSVQVIAMAAMAFELCLRPTTWTTWTMICPPMPRFRIHLNHGFHHLPLSIKAISKPM